MQPIQKSRMFRNQITAAPTTNGAGQRTHMTPTAGAMERAAVAKLPYTHPLDLPIHLRSVLPKPSRPTHLARRLQLPSPVCKLIGLVSAPQPRYHTQASSAVTSKCSPITRRNLRISLSSAPHDQGHVELHQKRSLRDGDHTDAQRLGEWQAHRLPRDKNPHATDPKAPPPSGGYGQDHFMEPTHHEGRVISCSDRRACDYDSPLDVLKWRSTSPQHPSLAHPGRQS